nr:hsdR [uncultured Enterobacter sp.]
MPFNINSLPDAPPETELSQDVKALINNGLDFLDKAREEMENSKPKFSIVSFWTAVEILLKVPLVHEHWTLVCSKKNAPKKKAYKEGDFQSVTYGETTALLREVLEKPLTKETDDAFEKVRKHRNRVVHFYHPHFTESEIQTILEEQANAWFALNRLMRDEWSPLFAANHRWKLAYDETRLIRGNEFYAAIRFRQVDAELNRLKKSGLVISECSDCRQKAAAHEEITTGNEERKLIRVRCRVCNSTSRHLLSRCPECSEPVSLSEGDEALTCEHCKEEHDRYKVLDEETFRSIDEAMDSVLPAGCTSCASPESVCKFGDGYLCTQCLFFYDELHGCECCGHFSDSVPKLSIFKGCEFCDGDHRYLDD